MVAKKYAKALMEIMMKENLIGPVREDIKDIRKITADKKACDYLADRAVSKKDKMDSFLGCHPLTKSFLNMVIDNKREKELYGISREYMNMLNSRLKEADVEVSSGIALSVREKEALRQKLEARLKRKVNLTYKIDRQIIGGLRLRYDSTVLDATVNEQLSEMLARMVA
jgi:F-type H+-transporting ATPase subunit delta